jgi:hypothetical protein
MENKMVKIGKKHHIRKRGPGKGKLRRNPKRQRGKFGLVKSFPNVNKTMFLQDPGTGLMEGRETVRGKGDGTGIYREDDAGRITGRTKSKHLGPYTPTMNKVRFGK